MGAEEQQMLTNSYQPKEKAKETRVAERLVGHRVDVVRLRLSLEGKEPVYVFGDDAGGGIEVIGRPGALPPMRPSLRDC